MDHQMEAAAVITMAKAARGGARRPPPPARVRPRYRTIMAVDIEGSTSRTDPVKAELRRTLYRLLEEAFARAGIEERHREEFVDRGDGALVLVRPLDEVPKTLLLHPMVPILAELLAEHNAGPEPDPERDRRMRIRVVVHAGEVQSDGRGSFGEALDVAFRLLDCPEAKDALRAARAPLLLVVSEDIYQSIVRHGYEGIDARAYHPLVRLELTGRRHRGWVRDVPRPPRGGARPLG
ncbi:hypothetical protein [Actinomadura sp. NEAU-AAG7]|uniref:hypothetical protein n=1 Tax=Actinomadura sp. NEAU-AAG7 TaxID=2839640 RepID=UPI001BE46E04|nr:hypothetical protein [Actinomadura sp. NEAU-AAG7]MBT2213292.1 hypothetical protein [Actinomadura sp. NEAU-AAG7]